MKKRKVPALRFKGFTKDWEQRKLGEVFLFLQNNTVSRAELNDENGNAKNIHYGDVLIKYGEYLDVNKENLSFFNDLELKSKFQDSYLQNGDIIVADTAEDETVGKCTEIMGLTHQNVVSGLHTIPMRPQLKFAAGYLGFYLNANSYHAQLKPLMQGIKVTSISKGAIQNTLVKFPTDYSEQEILGKLFLNLNNLITLHQRKLEKLKKIKKSMLEKMFPKSEEKIPEIRFSSFINDWEQRKLGDMGSTFTGLSGKTKEDFGHGKAKFITYMNVFSNPVADWEMMESVEIDLKQNCVKAGDVFFTTSSETPEEVGMSCVLLENADNIYLNSFCFGYRPIEKFDLNYLAYVLRSDSFRKEMTFLAQGISRYNISKNRVMEVEIPVPLLNEQKMVGVCFKKIDTIITLHQRKLKKLQNIKKSLLERMFV